MSLLVPKEKRITIVQDMNKFKWVGVPFYERYSQAEPTQGIKSLVKKLRKIDEHLDLKFFRPTEKWHLVRYYHGASGSFVKVWELEDRPDLGLRAQPGEWMIDALKAADTWGHAANRVEEVDANNQKIDESKQRAIDDACGEVAKEMRKPLQHIHDFGDNGSYKGVF